MDFQYPQKRTKTEKRAKIEVKLPLKTKTLKAANLFKYRFLNLLQNCSENISLPAQPVDFLLYLLKEKDFYKFHYKMLLPNICSEKILIRFLLRAQADTRETRTLKANQKDGKWTKFDSTFSDTLNRHY